MQEPISRYFKVSSMKTHDDSIDPWDYLESFKTLMILQEVSNILMCKS